MGKSYLPDGQGAIFKNIIRFAGGTPLDGRVVVDTYNDIAGDNYKALFTHEGVESFYVGMLVVTKDTGKLYVLTEEVETTTELNDAGEEIIVSNTVAAFKEVTPDLADIEDDIADALDRIADLEETDITGVTVNGKTATVDEKNAIVDVSAVDIKLGEAIMNGEEVKYSADTKVSTVLQSIQESIRGAIAGGVNSVSAGDKSITVNSADANNPVITLNTEVSTEETLAEGHIAVIKGDNGIYAAMYYDGDDVE
jgi:hypothetical protein